jgi:hypothetical protein
MIEESPGRGIVAAAEREETSRTMYGYVKTLNNSLIYKQGIPYSNFQSDSG